MHLRAALAAAGAAVAVSLLVTVSLVELLPFEFSALVGVPVGLLAGIVTFVAVFAEYRFAGALPRRAAVAAAGFGYAVLSLLFVGYADLGGLRGSITPVLLLVVGVATATVVYLGLWARDRDDLVG
jgi:hypothetical protein